MTVTFVVLAVLSQLPPGPLDGFRANFALIKAKMDFEFTGGAFKDNARLWEGKISKYEEYHIPDRDLTITGQWACDGSAEYYRYGSPEEILDRASRDRLTKGAGKVYYKTLFIEKTEALWDGEILCGHQNHPHYRNEKENPHWKIVHTSVIGGNEVEAGYLGGGSGPFHFPRGAIFPHVLKSYGSAPPLRRQALRWGNPTEVEVYRQDLPDGKGWRQLEVSYDPAIGYLPRFVRALVYYSPKDAASFDETYLIDARPCTAGGFVPAEWYNIAFDVPNFKARHPKYDESTDLAPPLPRLSGGCHFRASNIRDFTGPVALVELQEVHSIAAMGGTVPRPKNMSSLSFDDLERLLGDRIRTPAQRIMMNIDMAEMRELDAPPSRGWRRYIVALAVATLVIAGLLRWRRRLGQAAALSLVILGGNSGCGHLGEPVIKLAAGYKEAFVLIEPRTRELPMTLVVRNDGNRTLRLLKPGGGCSCRKVDDSAFPVVVEPGKMITVPVTLSTTPTTMPQSSLFEFETEKGIVAATAPYFTLLSHELNPENIANINMFESDEWAFDLTHRAIYPGGGAKPQFQLRFPKEFSAVRETAREGRVGGAPNYAFLETKYRVTLKDRFIGAHRTAITVVNAKGEVVLEAPV